MDKEQEDSWNIFVSYSRLDRELVKPIVDLLRITGSKIFRDEDTIKPGKKWKLVIAESLHGCKTAVVFWCMHSASSTEVRREYSHAIKWEKDVVPVLLDDTELPKALAEYQMVDFRVFSGFVAAHEPSFSDVANKSSSGALRGAAAGAAAGAAVGAFFIPVSLITIGLGAIVGGAIAAASGRPTSSKSSETAVITEEDKVKMAEMLYSRILKTQP